MKPEDIQIWASVIQSAGVIVASFIAIWGINFWRIEFTGKRKIELAEEFLALFYEAKEAIKNIRESRWDSSEIQSRQVEINESPLEAQWARRRHVISQRYKRHTGLFSKLHSIKFRCMSSFGRTASEPFDEIARVRNSILNAIDELIPLEQERELVLQTMDRFPGLGVEKAEDLKTQIKNKEKIIFSQGESDEINIGLNNLIQTVESICEPILNKKTLAQKISNLLKIDVCKYT